jgi:hypothetical protein
VSPEEKAEKAKEPEELTPSAHALKVAGAPKEGESDEQLNARAEKYAAAKKAARWG